jgi:hypothetical protein
MFWHGRDDPDRTGGVKADLSEVIHRLFTLDDCYRTDRNGVGGGERRLGYSAEGEFQRSLSRQPRLRLGQVRMGVLRRLC